MRDETEWVETIATGWNVLVGPDSEKIIEAIHSFTPSGRRPALYGDGSAAQKCVDLLSEPVRPIITDVHAVPAL
jgi:UDP-N-acetylglucosamine 2-epimerase